MRLIDADALIEQLKKSKCTGCDNYNGVRCRACQYDDEMADIDDAPTVFEPPDNPTNGDMIKAMFPDCKDWKAKLEDNDGEVYEVHFVQLPNSLTVNKYEESWWNAPYERR